MEPAIGVIYIPRTLAPDNLEETTFFDLQNAYTWLDAALLSRTYLSRTVTSTIPSLVHALRSCPATTPSA